MPAPPAARRRLAASADLWPRPPYHGVTGLAVSMIFGISIGFGASLGVGGFDGGRLDRRRLRQREADLLFGGRGSGVRGGAATCRQRRCPYSCSWRFPHSSLTNWKPRRLPKPLKFEGSPLLRTQDSARSRPRPGDNLAIGLTNRGAADQDTMIGHFGVQLRAQSKATVSYFVSEPRYFTKAENGVVAKRCSSLASHSQVWKPCGDGIPRGIRRI